jgi:glutathionylspermidine synthase
LLELHRTYKGERSFYGGYCYELQGETFTSWDLRGDRMYQQQAERFLKCMQNCNEDTDKVKLMLMLTEGCGFEENRVVSTEETEREYNGQTYKSINEIREYKYKPSTIVNRIDYIIKKGADVFTMKEVEVTKPMTNLD